jgi:hypothetical protein
MIIKILRQEYRNIEKLLLDRRIADAASQQSVMRSRQHVLVGAARVVLPLSVSREATHRRSRPELYRGRWSVP